MVGHPPSVLIVDDEAGVCELIAQVLSARGFRCVCALTGVEALRHLRDRDYDVAVVDIAMPDVSGLELLRALRDGGLRTRAIGISGVAGRDLGTKARREGAWAFFEKPFDVFLLADTVARAAQAAVRAESA
jgi:DNA-binding NtrC family response regulator